MGFPFAFASLNGAVLFLKEKKTRQAIDYNSLARSTSVESWKLTFGRKTATDSLAYNVPDGRTRICFSLADSKYLT